MAGRKPTRKTPGAKGARKTTARAIVAGDNDTDGGEIVVAEVVDEDEVADSFESGFDVDADSEFEGELAEELEGEPVELAGDLEGEELEGEEIKARSGRLELIKRDPLSAYVQETKRYPLLSREEEHELAVHFVNTGDTGAARRLIEANLRLVVKIAYEYRRAHSNLLDLVQEGNLGLLQAVKKYDPYRGVKLSSYAAWWIRAYILKFILNNWRLVKIGTTQAQRKLFFALRKERERLEQLGFTPTAALLAENLEVSEKDVVEMEQRMAAPDTSLDAPVPGVNEDGLVRTRMDFLPGEEGERPDVQVAGTEVHDLLSEKLEIFARTLKGRDATIFRERLLTDEPLTLQEIGDRYGVSRERARQIEKRLVKKLREYLEDELGTAVDIDAMIRE